MYLTLLSVSFSRADAALKLKLYVLLMCLHLRYSRTQMVEDATMCVFGSHISKPDRCSLMIFNSRREEKVIAETDYHSFGAIAYLNGEIIFYFYFNYGKPP